MFKNVFGKIWRMATAFVLVAVLSVVSLYVFVHIKAMSYGVFLSAKFLNLPIALSQDGLVRFSDLSETVSLSNGRLPAEAFADVARFDLAKKLGVERDKCVVFQMNAEECLRFAWNQNKQENFKAHLKADEILTALNQGADFARVSEEFSMDEFTKTFDGDAGFVNLAEILPEFRLQVDGMKPRDLSVISSREGLHIIRMGEIAQDEQGSLLYRIYQIFLPTENLDQWLKSRPAPRLWKFFP